ncbi:18S rRNA (guanine1575-N7)-methyltransferase [Nematocida major]|uniref:18S rRNA (guanine1575-N7)-methyltransferase n=1 Tax=Nematocida major TaxID=1912982 RepID=UPI0020076DB0|nr:18S rRNA (guanine1575-N7)-methyltransferase [Nematocida major]KAH9386963.1 18S rRNA (guanine1575-N7)-methyltransferase [Nematocida major]
MGRPEELGNEIHYTGEVAENYDRSTSINRIQRKLTERCLEILNNPTNSLVLDIGCGSGISTEHVLSHGNFVLGVDISRNMLDLAQKRVDAGLFGASDNPNFDFASANIFHGLPLRSASVDCAISVSVLQWIFIQEEPARLLGIFFYTLYDALKATGTAVLQYYPESNDQVQMILRSAGKYGFHGGTLLENQTSKKKRKTYLILEMPAAKGKTNHISGSAQKPKNYRPVANRDLTRREWILRKKVKREERGFSVPKTSKYTGRRR